MTVSEFFTKYNGRPIDFDGYYGNQCMDLYNQYNKEVVGAPRVIAPLAHEVWTKNLYPTNFYTKIANTPNGIPQKGDIVIWSKYANGGPGHIAVYYDGDVMQFRSFDQNWPTGSYCHFQPHNYNYVLGWLRPKVSVNNPEKLISSTQIRTILDGPGSDGDKLIKIRALL